jgi:hypothetical protein
LVSSFAGFAGTKKGSWMKCCFEPVVALVVACVLGAAGAAAQTLAPDIQKMQDLLDRGSVEEALGLCEAFVQAHPDEQMGWFLLARARHADGNLAGAIEAGTRAATYPGVRASSYYNLACAHALLGHTEEAFAALRDAKRAGFANRDLMAADADLASIRNDPRFVLPVERIYSVLDVGDDVGLPYSIDLPVNFDPTKTYPVLIGPGDADPAMAMTASLFWGEDSSQRGWIVVESPVFAAPDPVPRMAKLLDHVAGIYRVEGGKFHIAGLDVTGVAAFSFVAAMPGRFHSVTGMPGYPATDEEDDLLRFQGVIASFIVGERDPQWLEEARYAHDRLGALGVETYLEVIQGGGHILEELFGGEFMERMDALRHE